MVSIIILGNIAIYASYKISWIRSNRALEKTGEWSFMLYMVHAFTLQILNDNWYSILIFLLSTYIIAYTIYTFVYKKIQNAV